MAIINRMKIKLLLSVLAGFLLGVLAMWFLVKQTTVKVFANQFVMSVMNEANVGLHLRAGKQQELLKQIEDTLPTSVLAVDRDFRGNAAATNALWMVKAYYERNQIPIPAEIKSILESLPQKPPTACQVRLRALDKATTTNRTDAGVPK
jgi:hypothetical protein